MSNLTRLAIRSAFLKLLNERPLNKITVKDIVETCGINRNSFYYHYQDIPALMEEMIQEQITALFQAHPAIGSIEACFDTVISTISQQRQAILHIYNSASRESFETYLMTICRRLVTTYVDTAFAGLPIDEADRKALIRFLKCELFGFAIDWLNEGLPEDYPAYIHRVLLLEGGSSAEKIRARLTQSQQ